MKVTQVCPTSQSWSIVHARWLSEQPRYAQLPLLSAAQSASVKQVLPGLPVQKPPQPVVPGSMVNSKLPQVAWQVHGAPPVLGQIGLWALQPLGVAPGSHCSP